jgi:hypothetical protein
MEKFRNLVLEANRKLRLADHMAHVTYPMLKETKLLLTILNNIDLSLKASLDAYLYYERLYKRISPHSDDLRTKLEIFEKSAAKRYDLQNYSKLIMEVHNILKKHRESPMAFVKKEKLVICNGDYRMKILEISDVKNHLSKAKPFISRLTNVLKENDAYSRR